MKKAGIKYSKGGSKKRVPIYTKGGERVPGMYQTGGPTFEKGTVIKTRNCMDPNVVCSDEEFDLYNTMKNRMKTQERATSGDSQALNYLENNPIRKKKGGSIRKRNNY